jgi:hypothetical protein
MKTQAAPEIAMTVGPFLRLLMMLRERRAKVQIEFQYGVDHGCAVSNGDEPTEADTQAPRLRTDQLTFGPFLTMILALSKRPVCDPSNRRPIAYSGDDACPRYSSPDEEHDRPLRCRVLDALEAAASRPPLGRAKTHYGSGNLALTAVHDTR